MPTFKKKERLCSKKSIDFLFKNGSSFFSYPFNVKWQITNQLSEIPSEILIVVPKRNFKKATDRNHIKRLIREAFRLKKEILTQFLLNENKHIQFALIYSEKEFLIFKSLEDKIILTLQRLIKKAENAR